MTRWRRAPPRRGAEVARRKAAAKRKEAEERVIKKYSNRRLYDGKNSRYITLDELKELIVNGEDFRVCNASDGEDITRQTLISILFSGEVMGQPFFSEQTLRNMVMFMQGPMRGPMRVFVEQCMPLFARSNSELAEKFGHSISGQDLDSLAVLQGNMVRQVMEQYVFRGLENYLATQKNIEKMVSMQTKTMFPFSNMPGMPGMPGQGADKEGD